MALRAEQRRPMVRKTGNSISFAGIEVNNWFAIEFCAVVNRLAC
jgi:hypothetical protein